MTLRVFNTMTHKKEELVPLKPGEVSLYVCGITPYDYCHIGHARVYVVFDAIVRWLRKSYSVKYVRNFTDVDDKIIKRAQEAGRDPLELSASFIAAYHEDMDALHVGRADVEPTVTTHVPEIVAFIEDLVSKGFAYRVKSSSVLEGAGDDVYFRVKMAEKYTELSGRNLDDMQDGVRVAVDERKEDPLDFALWKSAKPGEPSWPSPFGNGRPGWHIECSAMAEKHLGDTIDLHGGGRDLIFPHHTNEIAQSEARHGGETFAKVWLHNGFVDIDGRKMSKSDGNFFTIREVFKQFTPESLRVLLLSTHYRSPIAYAPDLLEEAERRAQYLYETKRRVETYLAAHKPEAGPGLQETFGQHDAPFDPWHEFQDGLDDDFCTPRAVAALYELLKIANLLVAGQEKQLIGTKLRAADRARLLVEQKTTVEQMCKFLGIGTEEPRAFLERQRALRLKAKGIPLVTVETLIADRAAGRAAKDYAVADKARAALTELGIEVRDSTDGVEWSVI